MTDEPSLADRLALVEAELRALRHEVRTQRVVVVDADEVERVVLSASASTGSVVVKVDAEPGHTTGLELYAAAPPDEEPSVGLAELRDGNLLAERLP